MSSSTSPKNDPRTVLIKGVPGIGKTFLSKHIVSVGKWCFTETAKNGTHFFLSDPAVQEISNIEVIIMYFYKDKIAINDVKVCAC